MKAMFQHPYKLSLLACVAIPGLAVNAVAATLITNVVQTGGDAGLTAKWTGESYASPANNQPVPGILSGQSYTLGTFANLAPAFLNRGHAFTGASGLVPIPSYLVGGDYVMSINDNRDNNPFQLQVTVSQNVTAYILVDNRVGDNDAADGLSVPTKMTWLTTNGWTAMMTGANRTNNILLPDEVALDEGTNGTLDQYHAVYKKDFAAGTFSTFEQNDGTMRSMYGLVVVPEPSTFALLGLSLLALGIRRR